MIFNCLIKLLEGCLQTLQIIFMVIDKNDFVRRQICLFKKRQKRLIIEPNRPADWAIVVKAGRFQIINDAINLGVMLRNIRRVFPDFRPAKMWILKSNLCWIKLFCIKILSNPLIHSFIIFMLWVF